MAFADLAKLVARNAPKGTSARYARLDALERLLNGTLYDFLPFSFDQEDEGTRHILLRERRPSLVYQLARLIVDQTSSLTFGEAHFPSIRSWESEDASDRSGGFEREIERIVEACDLESAMMSAIYRGSIGSSAVIVRGIGPKRIPHIEVVSGKVARPIFNPKDPTSLGGMVQVYTVSGEVLQAEGYEKALADKTYWLRVEFDAKEERRFLPLTEQEFAEMQSADPDDKKAPRWKLGEAVDHGFGCTPVVWMVNPPAIDRVDGAATFEPIANFCVEIDYSLSQTGRGLRYSADPTLVVSRGDMMSLMGGESEGPIVKSVARALELGEGGSAKLLEITGQGLDSAREYVKMLREWALEVVGGMKADAENSRGPQSGRALEVLSQPLIWLVERMRIAYGTRGLLPVLRIILRGIKSGSLVIAGVDAPDPDASMRLVWPSWWTPRGSDLAQQANALQTFAGGSVKNPVALLSRDTVARLAATTVGLDDPNRAVRELVDSDETKPIDSAPRPVDTGKD